MQGVSQATCSEGHGQRGALQLHWREGGCAWRTMFSSLHSAISFDCKRNKRIWERQTILLKHSIGILLEVYSLTNIWHLCVSRMVLYLHLFGLSTTLRGRAYLCDIVAGHKCAGALGRSPPLTRAIEHDALGMEIGTTIDAMESFLLLSLSQYLPLLASTSATIKVSGGGGGGSNRVIQFLLILFESS